MKKKCFFDTICIVGDYMRLKCKFFIIILFLIFMPVCVSAKSVIQVINQGEENNYNIDANYGWTFNMKNVSAKASNYHLILSKDDAINKKIFYDADIDYNIFKYFYLDSESDCSSKKVYIVYNNVGMYHGKNVNLKLTVENCLFGYKNPLDTNKQLYLKSFIYNGERIQSEKPSIGFDSKTMQVIFDGIRSASLKYEFIDDSGNKINIKGYGTLEDLDFSQAFKMESGIDKAYIYEDYNNVCTSFNNLECINWEAKKHLSSNTLTLESDYTRTRTLENAIQSSNYETYSDNMYKYAWATILFSGGEFSLTYYLGEPNFLESWWDDVSEYDGFGGGMFKFSENSLVQFSIEDPIKSVNKMEIEKNEKFTYKISHRVPYINKDGSNNIYSKYEVVDVLESCFSLSTDDISIKNDEFDDVSSKFNISIIKEGEISKVSISAKEEFLSQDNFYGHEYEFLINTKVKDGYDLTKYINNDKTEYIIPNTSTINIIDKNNSYNKKTNRVDVVLKIKKEVIPVDDTGRSVSFILGIVGILLIICAILTIFLYRVRNKSIKKTKNIN